MNGDIIWRLTCGGGGYRRPRPPRRIPKPIPPERGEPIIPEPPDARLKRKKEQRLQTGASILPPAGAPSEPAVPTIGTGAPTGDRAQIKITGLMPDQGGGGAPATGVARLELLLGLGCIGAGVWLLRKGR